MIPRTLKPAILALLALAAVAALPSRGAQATAAWPGADYDPAIPTLKAVVGHDHGERISSPDEVVAYVRALAAAAPDRTRLVEYARTWEGRPLVYLVIGSPERIADLDAIKADLQRLAQPQQLDGETVDALVARLPGVAWLSYGVHGNEISSSDAALLTAYHVLAARGDAVVDRIRAETLAVIDPMQNPDGRARFVHNFRASYGIAPAASPLAAERDEPWPRGRTNHYLFDLNRDWFALSQPEVQGRVRSLLEYYPLVHVDIHEMGTDSSYYFPPPARPYNPHITEGQKQRLDLYGRTNARYFDEFGFDYFTREVYDALYPGYGDSWPGFHGAVGMTFEMASARGLVGERTDGTLLSYADGVQRHFVTSIGTLDTTASHRRELLEAFVTFRRTAAEGGAGDDREYLLPPHHDPGLVEKLAGKLVAQGIEVRRARSDFRACGDSYPAGTYVVSTRQGAGRLVRTLLDADSPLAADFQAEQERRRAKGLGAELYDVLAWSMPQLFNVDIETCGSVRAELAPWDGSPAGVAAPGRAEVAYLVPWGTHASGRFLAAALRDGLKVNTAGEGFTLGGRSYPGGSLIIKVADHDATLHQRIVDLAGRARAEVVASDTSYVTEGPSFGSRAVREVRPPRIALAWDDPTSPYSAGNTRYMLEREFGYPVTPVRTASLGRDELKRFDVVFLPDGRDYAGVLGRRGVEALARWVRDGGTLVGVAGGMSFLAADDTGLLAMDLENAAGAGGEGEGDGDRVDGSVLASEDDYQSAIAPDSPRPDYIPGVILRATVDPDHWLAGGLRDTLHLLVEGRDVYTPLSLDDGTNVARFAGPDDLVAGGHLWAQNREQWAYKPAVVIAPQGRGQVIGIVNDPGVRALQQGLGVLLLNATLLAPAHASPLR